MPRLKQSDIFLQDAYLRSAIKGASGYFGLTAADQALIAGVKRATWYRRLQDPSSFTVGELRRMIFRYHWGSKIICNILGAKESSPWDT